MRELKLGDIVRIRDSALAKHFKNESFGFVYDLKGDLVHVLWMIGDQKKYSSRAIKILRGDVSEGELPKDYAVLLDYPHLAQHDSIEGKVCKANLPKIDEVLRSLVYGIIEKHFEVVHQGSRDFIPGKTLIPYAGRIYDSSEMKLLADATLDFWLTAGRFAQQFEKEFADFLGVRHCLLTNSGSSANLLAVSALTSPKLGEKRLFPGDEVIAVASAFPTTVNPIVQNNLIPVFLDVEVGTYNIQADHLEAAISKKTKAIFLAHTLGNPFDVDRILAVAKKYKLWVIEDNCDALGARYKDRLTGTFGDIATFSFYPPHHMTMGEGGAVVTNNPQLKVLIESFRDWGRDCWCEPGRENTCGKRFEWQLGALPFGYDHKYIFSHVGYNLKVTDMQAAVGLAQLKKLPGFVEARKKNWQTLYQIFKAYEDDLILPQATTHADPSWFGFVLTVKKSAPFTCSDMVKFFEDNKIATRKLFTGNITRQPGYQNVTYRIHGNLNQTDFIMNDTFWIGVYPGLTSSMTDYIAQMVNTFFKENVNKRQFQRKH